MWARAAPAALATRLGQLGRALAAYADAMGDAWKRTTVVVISEVGRTFRENGNKGTDHGHGTVYWIMGGAVRAADALPAARSRCAATPCSRTATTRC